MSIEAATAEPALHLGEQRIGCGWFDSSYDLHEGLVVTEDVDLCMFELWSAGTLH